MKRFRKDGKAQNLFTASILFIVIMVVVSITVNVLVETQARPRALTTIMLGNAPKVIAPLSKRQSYSDGGLVSIYAVFLEFSPFQNPIYQSTSHECI